MAERSIKQWMEGISWEAISTGSLENYTSIFFLNNYIAHLTGANGLIFKSIDGGEKLVFDEKQTPNQELRSVCFYRLSAWNCNWSKWNTFKIRLPIFE